MRSKILSKIFKNQNLKIFICKGKNENNYHARAISKNFRN